MEAPTAVVCVGSRVASLRVRIVGAPLARCLRHAAWPRCSSMFHTVHTARIHG